MNGRSRARCRRGRVGDRSLRGSGRPRTGGVDHRGRGRAAWRPRDLGPGPAHDGGSRVRRSQLPHVPHRRSGNHADQQPLAGRALDLGRHVEHLGEDPGNPVLEASPGAWDGGGIGSIAVLHDRAMFHMWYGAGAGNGGAVHVGYATSSDGTVWTKYGGNPLAGLDPGAPGAWDDYGTLPKTVLVEGPTHRMWYTAFQGGFSGGTWRIGHASSTDGGITWTKGPTPVLEASQPWEGNKIYFPTVVRYGDRFAMWYSGHSGVTAVIGYAESPDGLLWAKWPANPVLTPVQGAASSTRAR